MINKKDEDYFKKELDRQNYFWGRFGGKPNFEGKTILDFGCGHGAMCMDIAKNNPKRIIGIDLDESYISFAKKNLEKNFPEYKNKVEFKCADLNFWKTDYKFDYIVSKETFEHTLNLDEILNSMYKLLVTKGQIFSGFGPLYNFYNGDHKLTKIPFPWFHLIFPKSFLINIINKKKEKKISSIKELGLNMYSLKDYLNTFNNSKFEIKFLKKNCSNNPFTFFFKLMSKIKFLEEYFTFNIFTVLYKND